MFKNIFKPKPENTAREQFVAEQEKSKEPWALFEIVGFEPDGRVKVQFNWNSAFIAKLKTIGFDAETEDDAVQLFFYTSQMRPTELSGVDVDTAVEDLPHISGANLVRG